MDAQIVYIARLNNDVFSNKIIGVFSDHVKCVAHVTKTFKQVVFDDKVGAYIYYGDDNYSYITIVKWELDSWIVIK